MAKDETKDLSKFFKLAKTGCANYCEYSQYKHGTKNYCLLEPKATEHVCLLYHNQFCRYFDESVIGYRAYKDLKVLWDELFHKTSYLSCQCGKKFEPTSARQKFCRDCGEENKKTGAKQRKRRQRKRGYSVTLLSH